MKAVVLTDYGDVDKLELRDLPDLALAAARGQLRIPIGKRLPISEVREAHRMAQQGTDGKILLVV